MKVVKFLSKVRRKKRIDRMLFDAAVVIALIGVGFAVKPAYRAFRDHQIARNLEAAKAAARAEDWGTARDQARSVMLARGEDFDASRIWVRALGKLGSPNAYLAVAALFTDPRATRADLLEALQVMALQAPQAVALSAYASLPPAFRDQAAFRAAITPLLIQRGESELAERSLREVAQPTDEPAVRLELLHALCSRPQAARVAESRRIFAELIAANAETEALAALLILGEVAGGLAPGEDLPDLPAWLKTITSATARHHLLGMNPALEAQPEAAERLYEAGIRRFLESDPGALGTWLVSHGQAETAAKLLKEAATTRSDAYLARLHALLRLGPTAELPAALAAPPVEADLIEIEIMRAKIAATTGDLPAADAAWTGALNQAALETSRNRCIEIARAAEACGAKDAAEKAWVAAIRLGWGQVPLYCDLLPVFASLVAKGRSEDLLAMFRMLLQFEPGNPELLHNAYYFDLLHGALTPDQVIAVLTPLVARSDQPVYHSTLMLAELLADRPAAALARLPKFRDSENVAAMMKAALEGTARILAGETEAGNAMLATVDWRGFMSQESIVFRNLLVRSKNSDLPLPELVRPQVEANPELIPAWRKAVERLEKERAGEVLPALPTPRIPGADPRVAPTEDS
jgi:hypothetical protein